MQVKLRGDHTEIPVILLDETITHEPLPGDNPDVPIGAFMSEGMENSVALNGDTWYPGYLVNGRDPNKAKLNMPCCQFTGFKLSNDKNKVLATLHTSNNDMGQIFKRYIEQQTIARGFAAIYIEPIPSQTISYPYSGTIRASSSRTHNPRANNFIRYDMDSIKGFRITLPPAVMLQSSDVKVVTSSLAEEDNMPQRKIVKIDPSWFEEATEEPQTDVVKTKRTAKSTQRSEEADNKPVPNLLYFRGRITRMEASTYHYDTRVASFHLEFDVKPVDAYDPIIRPQNILFYPCCSVTVDREVETFHSLDPSKWYTAVAGNTRTTLKAVIEIPEIDLVQNDGYVKQIIQLHQLGGRRELGNEDMGIVIQHIRDFNHWMIGFVPLNML